MLNSTSLSEVCATCSTSCAFLAPDPDVAGQGVVIAFLTTSVLTWMCASIRISYWFIQGKSSTNKIDGLLRRQSKANSQPPPGSILSSQVPPGAHANALNIAYLSAMTLLLSLHDTQLISGLAISATTLIRHRSDNISVYHFSVAADLSWVASGTQLVCFLFIHWDLNNNPRRPKRSTGKHRLNASTHTAAQYFRAFCMITQFALLLWQSYIQGDQRWTSSYACPTACLDGPGRSPVFGGIPVRKMVLNIVFATWGYSAALLPMCSPLLGIWKDFKVKFNFVSTVLLPSGRAETHHRIPPLSTRVLRICKLPLVFIWSLLASILLDTVMQLGWFAYGAYMLVADRGWGDAYFAGKGRDESQCDPVPNTEKDWGFGQIFPVMLLILPVMSLLQAYGDEMGKHISELGATSTYNFKEGQVIDVVPVVGEGSRPLPPVDLAEPPLRR